MSLSSEKPELEQWESVGSNSAQNYLTHSVFRYFGKLPPVLTRRILEEFIPANSARSPLVLDLMCGSGTTLVEAQSMGVDSIGVDSNDISILISRVKTTPLKVVLADKAIADFTTAFQLNKDAVNTSALSNFTKKWSGASAGIPIFRNVDKWFLPEVQIELAICKEWIEQYKSDRTLYDFLLLCWFSIIRQCSNASIRTGRIFHDHQKIKQPVYSIFFKKLQKNTDIFRLVPSSHFRHTPKLFLGDARTIDLSECQKADFTFFHPPYFALYKYSSDVLRFELEWGGYDRQQIVARELRDGFKTTRADLVNPYIDDLVNALINGFRYTKEGKLLGVVVGNSTLAEKQLPIIDEFKLKAKHKGIKCIRIIERPISHSQSTYHRSANPNIRSSSDFIMIFKTD